MVEMYVKLAIKKIIHPVILFTRLNLIFVAPDGFFSASGRMLFDTMVISAKNLY
jgi:hypothetical protein